MNAQFGFTDDGQVVMIIHSMADEKPLQTTLNMSPTRAREVAEILTKVAFEAEEKAKELFQ